MTHQPHTLPPRFIEVASRDAMTRTPKVSVMTLTYNHEPYIAQCIEGVMSQQTAFAIEMVIGEDGSTDRTSEICRAYQQRFPDRIRLLLAERNAGRFENLRQTMQACRGEYMALLEGDDYWTDPGKLRKQADLLDQHPEWAICFHNVNIIGDRTAGRPPLFFENPPKPVFTREDFIERNFIPTCSCVYRSHPPLALPAWFYEPEKNPYTDWILHVIRAEHGDIGYVDAVMATHRSHAGGIWGQTFDGTREGDISRMKRRLTTFERLTELMGPRCRRRLRRQRAMACFHIGIAYRELGDRAEARRFILRAFRTDPLAPAPLVRSLLAACRVENTGGAR